MDYTTLGNTGLRVSVAGLGCGGFSRIGISSGKSEEESVAIVRQALDLGVNFIDTAAQYGTESIVGKAIQGRDRDSVVISTKASVGRPGGFHTPEKAVASLDQSLQNLGVDCIDVFHLHGVAPDAYAYARETLVPTLIAEQEKGKFKFLGITEVPPNDHKHESLIQAVEEDCFRVIMIAHHMLHQSARTQIFPTTIKKGIGVLIMFAVRVLFSEKGRLQCVVQELVEKGQLSAELKDVSEPLGFLLHEGGAHSIIDAAYRYCRHEKGSDVVLFGTGNPDHVQANIESILSPPLPVEDVERLEALFGALTGIGLDRPGKGRR
ncbi:MAG: aldo/keto reductase [Candidatus Latescibacteria bacterium]|nr:aldo/keto reductase [Candidatus Latescibacterota bacterium]